MGAVLSATQGCSVQGKGSPEPQRLAMGLLGQLLKALEVIVWIYACIDTSWGFGWQQRLLQSRGRKHHGHFTVKLLVRFSCTTGTTEQPSVMEEKENTLFIRPRASL